MSKVAPWLALSIDWQESEMFDDAPHGVRLAWVCLLCFVKAQGRAGKARFRGKAFAENYRLSMESIDELLARAGKAGAVVAEDGYLTVVNWKSYQDPKVRHSATPKPPKKKRLTKKNLQISKSAATQHPAPTTNHPPPPWVEVEAKLLEFGVAKAADAVEAAHACGCEPGAVLNLIEWWRARRESYGVGALFDRIVAYRPGQDFTSLWPPPAVPVANAADKHETWLEKSRKQIEDRERRKREREAAATDVAESGFDALDEFKKLTQQ